MAKKTKRPAVKKVKLTDVDNPDWDELFDKLWDQGSYWDSKWGRRSYCRHQPEKVRLSKVGWEQIKKVIKRDGLIVEVINSCSGFSCAIRLWEPSMHPYPGVTVKGDLLFTMCSHMLPGKERSGFKEGWAAFEPLFTSDENVERLKRAGMQLPKPASYYDY
jgi:hypothetical protein